VEAPAPAPIIESTPEVPVAESAPSAEESLSFTGDTPIPVKVKEPKYAPVEAKPAKLNFIAALLMLFSAILAPIGAVLALILPHSKFVGAFTLDGGATWDYIFGSNGKVYMETKSLLSRFGGKETIAAVLLIVAAVLGVAALVFALIAVIKKNKNVLTAVITPIISMVSAVLLIVGPLMGKLMFYKKWKPVSVLKKAVGQYDYPYLLAYKTEMLPLIVGIIVGVIVLALAIVAIILAGKNGKKDEAIEEAAPVAEKAPAEEAPVAVPVEEAPAEEAPVEAPVEAPAEAPVEEPKTEEAPVEEAPKAE
jgi:hypothetical protein